MPKNAKHSVYDAGRVNEIVQRFAGGGEFTDPVEAEVEKQFGMKPGLDRATFLPFAGRRSEGNLEWAVPGTIYDLAKAYVLPGMAAQGHQVTPEESVQFASNLMGGAGTGSAVAPVEGTIAGMAVKNKGGNWVNNATRQYIYPLMQKGPTTRDEALLLGGPWATDVDTELGAFQIKKNAAINNWLETKLDRYIRNEMATPDDPLRIQADQWAVKKDELLKKKDAQIEKATAKLQQAQRERGVTPEMLTQSQAQIRQLEKERAYIDNQQGLHFTHAPEQGLITGQAHRKLANFPETNAATSSMGTSWEDLADAAVMPAASYRDQIPFMHYSLPENIELERLGGKYAVENPNALAYSLNAGYRARNLGFDHLVDELKNAMDPHSGLPEKLRRSPEDLEKMTVPQASKLVDEINAWRSVQKAEANAAIAGNAATQLVKEYPEAGLKWVELKMPEPKIPEGAYLGAPSGYPGLHGIIDSKTGRSLSVGATPEEALRLLNRKERQKALEDALKYEGEIMKHCVGGYCEDVASGESRIFSLRDENGKPQVTIEVQPNQTPYPIAQLDFSMLTPEKRAQYSQYVREWRQRNPHVEELTDEDVVQALREAGVPPEPDRIVQIKGANNRKPPAEVIPMIQDFVKSGNWAEIGDIRNAELRDIEKTTSKSFKDWLASNAKRQAEEKNIPYSRYVTEKEYAALEDAFNQDLFDSLNPQLKAEGGKYAKGGQVSAEDGSLDSLAQKYIDPVEAEVQRQFGMEPGLDRATFLPFAGRRSEGNLQWAVPGSIYELAKAYVLPGEAAKGHVVTPQEAMDFASNVMGGAATGSSVVPVEGTIAGMAVKSAKKKSDHPDVFPAATPFKKEEIEQMADRISRQMTGVDNPNKKTLIQLEREKTLPVNIRTNAPKQEFPIIDYSSKKGSYLIGVPGDPSIGGMLSQEGIEPAKAAVEVLGIGERTFDNPVGQFGGKEYGAFGHPYGWAGNISGVRPLSNVAQRLNELSPDAEVLGQFVKMTPQSLDFTTHNLATLLAYQQPEKFPKKYINQLNKMIRDEEYLGYDKYPQFAGFQNPEQLMLDAQMDSDLRKKIVAVLSKKKNVPTGTPQWDDVIYAISHPELRNLETGVSGSTVLRMDPTTDPASLISPHPTYANELPSTVIGTSRYMAPAELAYPRSLAYAREQIEKLPLPEEKRKLIVPFNQAKMTGLRELIDQQYIDQIGEYERQMKKKLGYKKGGLSQLVKQ